MHLEYNCLWRGRLLHLLLSTGNQLLPHSGTPTTGSCFQGLVECICRFDARGHRQVVLFLVLGGVGATSPDPARRETPGGQVPVDHYRGPLGPRRLLRHRAHGRPRHRVPRRPPRRPRGQGRRPGAVAGRGGGRGRGHGGRARGPRRIGGRSSSVLGVAMCAAPRLGRPRSRGARPSRGCGASCCSTWDSPQDTWILSCSKHRATSP